jgi:hypothetical protein
MERGRQLVARVTQEVALDVMTSFLCSKDGEYLTPSDAGRLEMVLTDAIGTAVDRCSENAPVDEWTVQHTVGVVENAATDALVDWTLRREALVNQFVDPAITAATARACIDGEEPPSPPPDDLLNEVRAVILEALDRPPVRSDGALWGTAEAMAWAALRRWIRSVS